MSDQDLLEETVVSTSEGAAADRAHLPTDAGAWRRDHAAAVPDDSAAARSARRFRRGAVAVLTPVALIGATLSFTSIYAAAAPIYGPVLAAAFPLLVDFLILGTLLMYVAGAKVGRPRAGWRLTAHAGVAGTLFLNALAARQLQHVPWHVVAPAVWSVLVELTAREVLGEWRATHTTPPDRIPLALWLSAPIESARTRLLMMRTGERSATAARRAVGVHAAARSVMRRALGRRALDVRRTLRRQLRAGSLEPAVILAAVGWHPGRPRNHVSPDLAVRHALVAVLLSGEPDLDCSLPALPAHDENIPDPLPGAPDPGEDPSQLSGRSGEEAPTAGQAGDDQARAKDDDRTADLLEQLATAQRQRDDAQRLAEEREGQLRQAHMDASAWSNLLDGAPLQVLELARQTLAGELPAGVTGAEVAERYGCSERTGRRWLADATQMARLAAAAGHVRPLRPLTGSAPERPATLDLTERAARARS